MPLDPVVNSVMMASHYSIISGPGVEARLGLSLSHPHEGVPTVRDILREVDVGIDAAFIALDRLEDMLAVAARAQICPAHFFQEGS